MQQEMGSRSSSYAHRQGCCSLKGCIRSKGSIVLFVRHDLETTSCGVANLVFRIACNTLPGTRIDITFSTQPSRIIQLLLLKQTSVESEEVLFCTEVIAELGTLNLDPKTGRLLEFKNGPASEPPHHMLDPKTIKLCYAAAQRGISAWPFGQNEQRVQQAVDLSGTPQCT